MQAFETLVRSHADAVYGHALRFFGDTGAAQDAAQEVFLKVHRSLGDFDGRSAFSTWLYRITRNVCLDMFRRGRKRAEQHNGAKTRKNRATQHCCGPLRYAIRYQPQQNNPLSNNRLPRQC